jgi:uncharacterized protein (TIGR00251 family)
LPAETGDIRLSVKVTPNANRNEIGGFRDGVLQLKIAAPPVKGKANRELISFLSDVLGVSMSSLSIVKGQTSRNKIIAVDGLSQEDIINRLSG